MILDWVPAHFPRDDWALARFDGTALYEHEDPRRGEHPDWGTLVFNFGRNEVRNFLLASALYWLREYHADGIRVDAVASMLYLDYSRKAGEWIPNEFGGREDLDAVVVPQGAQRGRSTPASRAIVSAAEESTAWPGVSRPTYVGGLGFGFKWNMGWMHDTLGLLPAGPDLPPLPPPRADVLADVRLQRELHPAAVHDEVVHGKGSLLDKMPGDTWQKLANLRCLYAYMWAHPGKKLLFMGCEFAQEREWSHERSLDWHLLEDAEHAGVQSLVRDLNHVYRDTPALWEVDDDARGFYWLEANDADAQRRRLRRVGEDRGEDVLVCVCNLSPVAARGLPRRPAPRRAAGARRSTPTPSVYGGTNIGNMGGVEAEAVAWHGQPCSARRDPAAAGRAVARARAARPVTYRVLPAGDAFWRPSNQMGVLNTDLAKQLEATTLGARMWRLVPGQASTRHRHREQAEL